MAKRFNYHRRIPVNLLSSKVKETLPEYFLTEYPNLVSFLETYYEKEENDPEGFTYLLQNLYQSRDLTASSLADLDNIFYEIGNNTALRDYFLNNNPRKIAKLFALFYRMKGSKTSALMFFRGFFGEEIDIEYPKRNMFIINESRIGPDSLRYIQDAERYQIHSILIKSGIPISKWEALYKRFVHPSGWYLAADVFIESVVNLNLDLIELPLSIEDSAAGTLVIETVANGSINTLNTVPLTLIIPDNIDSDLYANRIDATRNLMLFANASITLKQFDDQYTSFVKGIDANSPTFDQDSDGIIRAVDFSNAIETMDRSIYDYWDSTNNSFQYQDSA